MALPIRSRPRPDVVVDDLAERLRAVEARLAQLERRLPISDHELLAAIALAIGSATFTQLELEAHAEVDPTLRETLERSPKPLGPALRRLAERPCGGFVLRRIKREFSGWRWFVTTSDGM